tara:strand:+ start:143 stop:412 length:270 start_codon:yes stop_codon:yes gene_type:complete
MLTTIALTISLITNIGLIYYLFKLNGNLNDLEIKLKVTRDYANQQAEKTLTKVRQEAKEAAETVVEAVEQVAQVARKRRGRKKKNTNVQ